MPTNDHRLPRDVRPTRYELTLEPDLDAATFAGTVAIAVDVTDAVDEVALNAIELEIDEAWLENEEGIRRNATVRLDEETERAHLALEEPAAAGSWTAHLTFRGILNDKLHGFYRSTFTDDEGNERLIATTQFEATDARRAFPCWDEPDAKAVFAVTLVVPDDLTAISNAAEVERTPADEGKVAVRFADTIPMSTYLVAFVVGPLEVTDPVDVDGTPLRVVHPPGKAHLTAYALEVGAFALRFFEDYYAIGYPGDKLDLVAIPDFAFGAMENLGCVTFREVLLLVDPDAVTQPELQNVVDVIAHELAHMWFGDLVTMKWWNGIWLNEAFATFMEMLVTDAFRPDWDRWVSFGLSRTAAFDVDALASTRPIEFEVVSPADAEGMFDILTYEKGAAVVRMLEQYLGADSFQAGIRRYLAEHTHGNTETTDLWDAIEAANPDVPVRSIMDSWIFQGGFPVVSVTRDQDEVRFSQSRFAYLPETVSGEETWSVPILLSQGAATADTSSIRHEKLLLDGPDTASAAEGADWVLLNAGGSGFYRVRYDAPMLDALVGRAQEALSPLERYGLVDDTWAAVLAAQTGAVEFLEFAEGMGDETDLSVWQRLVGSLGSLDRLLDGDPRISFRRRVGELVGPAYERVGAEPRTDEGDRDRSLRATLFGTLGDLAADPDAQERARELYAAATSDEGSVDPSLLAASVSILASLGGAERYEDFLARFRSASTPQQELRYLTALADFPEPDLFDRTLELTLAEVRSQNGPYLLRRALTNRERGPDAWAFLEDHWDEINERFPSNSIARLLEGIRSLSTADLLADVEAFLDAHPVPQGARTVAQHLERLRVNVALREREAERLAAALR